MKHVTDITIVQRCRDASPAINDYFLEERYLLEVDQNEAITSQLLTVMAINLLLDEVAEIGIETNRSAEDLMTSTLDLETLFCLREKLDKYNLYKFISSLDENKISDLNGVLENASIAEDVLYELTDFAVSVLPTDLSWETVQRSIDCWYSTEAFVRHTNAIMSKVNVHNDPNTTFVDDSNIHEIAAFLQRMKERSAIAQRIGDWICEHRTNINKVILNDLIKNYDHEKLKHNHLPLFAHDATVKHSVDEKEPWFLEFHHKTVSHHLEYWQEQMKIFKELNSKVPFQGPSPETTIMIFVSLILDGYRKEELKKHCEEFRPYGCADFMIGLCDVDWDGVMKGESVNEA